MIEIFKELEKFRDVKYFDKDHSYKIRDNDGLGVSKFISKFKDQFEREKIAAFTAKKLGTTVEEVLKQWDYKKEAACEKGHIFHSYAENFDNNKIFPIDDDKIFYKEVRHSLPRLFQMFEEFKESCKDKLISVASELVIGDYNYNLCGTADKIFYNVKYETLQIFDWKTNSELSDTNKYSSFKGPWKHLESSKLNEYSLQMSAYRWIIENNTNLKFGDSYVIWFNESNPTFVIKKLKDLRKEVVDGLEYLKNSDSQLKL